MGNLGLRKILKKETMYKDKTFDIKHKCDFSIHCVLRVKRLNGRIENYNVMKCNKCSSFISIKEKGNIRGHIFEELNEEQKKLPLINAFLSKKKLIINFSELDDVFYEN